MKLQLEYGKRYVRGDGKVTGPLCESRNTRYTFKDPLFDISYTEHGQEREGIPAIINLVSEYLDPEFFSERRYDLAKDCLLTLLAIGTIKDGWMAPLEATEMAIIYADLLLEKLGETRS